MNRTVGLTSSIVTFIACIGFLISLANRIEFAISLSGFIMCLGFTALITSFSLIHNRGSEALSYTAICFVIAATAIFAMVYIPELTVERTNEILSIGYLRNSLSYRYLGFMFYYLDMIAVALLSLSLFFTGFTINATGDEQKFVLKATMFVQIVFALVTIAASYFRLFADNSNSIIARTLMIAWSGTMAAICVASYLHFYNFDY